ncbi:hypothetical protein N9E16_00945 [Planktomarina temperata]|nr:hypothetical protein [bacterium]MDA9971773.1 hypothetical protein [Planktomarina temperata]
MELDKEAMGIVTLLASLMGYSLLASLGLTSLGDIKLPTLLGEEKRLEYQKLSLAIFNVGLFGGIVVCLVQLLIVYNIVGHTNFYSYHLYLYSIAFFLTPLNSAMLLFLRVNARFVELSIVQSVTAVANHILVIIFVYTAGLRGFIYALPLALIFQSKYLIKKNSFPISVRATLTANKYFREGFSLLFLSAMFLFFRSIDVFYLANSQNLTELGEYSIVTFIILIIYAMVNSFSNVYFQKFQQTKQEMNQSTRENKYIIFPFFTLLLLVSLINLILYFTLPMLLEFVAPGVYSYTLIPVALVTASYLIYPLLLNSYNLSVGNYFRISFTYLIGIFFFFTLVLYKKSDSSQSVAEVSLISHFILALLTICISQRYVQSKIFFIILLSSLSFPLFINYFAHFISSLSMIQLSLLLIVYTAVMVIIIAWIYKFLYADTTA